MLTQPPIMSTLEVPSKTVPLRAGGVAADGAGSGGGGSVLVGAAAGAALDSDSLAAVIGVTAASKTNQNIPASLALPITITDPTIAAKTTQASIKSVYLTTTSAALSDGTEIWDPMHTTTTTTSNTADNEEEEEDEITTITIEEEDQNGELEEEPHNVLVLMENVETDDGVEMDDGEGNVLEVEEEVEEDGSAAMEVDAMVIIEEALEALPSDGDEEGEQQQDPHADALLFAEDSD